MSNEVDRPDGSKQGCRECGGIEFHDTITCPLVSGRDKSLYRSVPVLPSERSAGDERKCLNHCQHDPKWMQADGLCHFNYAVHPSSATWKDTHCGHRCAFAPREAERHEFESFDEKCCTPVGSKLLPCGLPREAEVHGEADEHLYPHQQCSGCGEMFETTNRRLLHRCKGTAAPPTTRTREEIARENQAAIALLDSWLAMPEAEDDGSAEAFRRYIQENSLSDRGLPIYSQAEMNAALTTAADEAKDSDRGEADKILALLATTKTEGAAEICAEMAREMSTKELQWIGKGEPEAARVCGGAAKMLREAERRIRAAAESSATANESA